MASVQRRAPGEISLPLAWEVGLALGCGLLLTAGVAAQAGGCGHRVHDGLFVAALLVGAVAPVLGALPQLWARHVDVDLLMLLGGFGAATLNQCREGAILMLLFSGSGALESYTSGRTRRSIEALKSHLETVAVRLLAAGHEEVVPLDRVAVGDRLLIRPGARIPTDGSVLDGCSSVNNAALTGESLPVPVAPGAEVMAGAMNSHEGAITLQVTRAASDSTVARMVRLVEDAVQNKARTQVFTDWFGQRYTLVVIVGTLLTFGVMWLALGRPWQAAAYRAMTLLVVASPCALVLATPAAILAAIAGAARRGILVKGGGVLEQVARVQAVVFDKTGTLTLGQPAVARIITLNGVAEDDLLRLAASAERHSEHPLAASLVAAAEARGLRLVEPESFRSFTGRGVVAQVAGRTVLIGNARLFAEHGLAVPVCGDAACADRDGFCRALRIGAPEPIGLIDVADAVRPEAAAAVTAIRAAGVRQVAMLTGDAASAATAIGRQTGVDNVHAGLLPEDKLARLRQIREQHGVVMMVGDGVNDAPALAAAEVGVAMGGIGSDVALETADVVLTTDDLSRLPVLLRLSRRATRTVVQNLVLAISVMVVMSGVVLSGAEVPLSLAVVAHEGSTVLVILNGLRLLRA